MTYLIIVVTILLVFDILRARKKEVPVKPNYSGWEASAIAYNRAHGLPDDAI